MNNLIIKLITSLLLLLFASMSLAEQVTYYDTNNVGTPVAMWDAGARKVWETEYYPFGKEYQTSPAIKDNDRKFVGKEKDKETDLTYFGARYYDDLSGRFLAPDPVRPVDALTSKTNHKVLDNPQRLNRYAYGLNNPYKYVDPDGEFAFLIPALVGAGVAYLSSPDIGNAPTSSSAPTFESHGERSIALGAIGGAGLGQLATLGKVASDSAKVRHHTSPNGLEGIKNDSAINPSRGEPIGVHVEVKPFGASKTASTETGAFGKGSYVEFDAPANMTKTNVGPRNTAVIPSEKPLSIKDLNPKFKK